MFGLGFGEMLLILAVALIVIGPKKLPGVARTLGRGIAEFRRHADDLQRTIQRELHEPLRTDDLLRRTTAPGQVQPGPPPGGGTMEAAPPPFPYAEDPPPAAEADASSQETSPTPPESSQPPEDRESAAPLAGEPAAEPHG